MRLSNGILSALVHPPDPENGFYRGTRFDRAGIISDLIYKGHNFYPAWFQRMSPDVRDFIYCGPDIIAGPCTAATGPAEEFLSDEGALGFDTAAPGETFLKIGVGALSKPDHTPYDRFRLYEIADPGEWKADIGSAYAEFSQTIPVHKSGYGYCYRKHISLTEGKPQLMLAHTLRNIGRKNIDTRVYNHNFNYLDEKPPGPGTVITLPFHLHSADPPDGKLAELRGNTLQFHRTLSGEDRVQCFLEGYGNTPEDYDIRIDYPDERVGVRITADQPLARLVLWAIRAPLSIEPYIRIQIAPGEEFSWNLTYDYF